MNGYELEEHIKTGKRFIVYGDAVYFNPERDTGDPHTWYRKALSGASIAVNLATEEEYTALRLNGEPVEVMHCQWFEQDELDSRYYETDCGNSFLFIDGTPASNEMKFCCYCGKPITEESISE